MAKQNQNENDRIDPKLIKVSMILLLGMIAPALNATVVNVAIKTFATAFSSNISVVQWLATTYILAMGIAVPFSGWLINHYRGKTVYMVSLVVFCLGSVGAIFAWNIESLIVFRAIQGAGTGVLMPVMQTLLVRFSGVAKLPSLMAILSIPTVIIPILGPTIGGLIVSNLPWQWIFIINIPICVVALILSQMYLPADEAVDRDQPIDLIGLLLLSPAFCVLIFGISALQRAAGGAGAGGAGGVPQYAVLLLAGGVALLIAYCIYVLHSSKEPPLDIRLFRHRNFSATIILIFMYGLFSTGTLIILPLYFQQAYHTSAFTAGLLLAPQGIGMLATRTLSAKWTEKSGARPAVFAGIIITLAGTVPLSMFFIDGNLILPAVLLFVRGAGLGMLFVPVMSCVYDGLDKRDIPQGTTATRIFQQIGGAFGTAILAIILYHGLNAAGGANPLPAFDEVFWWSSALTAITFAPVFFLAKTRELSAQ